MIEITQEAFTGMIIAVAGKKLRNKNYQPFSA